MTLKALAIAAALLAPLCTHAGDDVATLLKKADRYRTGGEPLQVETEVTVLKADGSVDKERRYTVFTQPERRSLVLMRSPAEAGQKVLMLGDDFWLLMPGTERPMRITPAQKLLGDASTAPRRLNFAQAFNGLGAALATWLGGRFILSGHALTDERIAGMDPQALDAFYTQEALAVRLPYLIIGLIVLVAAVLFLRTHLPEIDDSGNGDSPADPRARRRLTFGVIAQFCYVGAQVGVASFFIRFSGKVAGIGEKDAAYLLSIGLLLFMSGRFIGTALMKWMSAPRLLAICAFANLVLIGVAVAAGGYTAVVALLGVELFMSIMFPTIFSLSIEGLGRDTKLGSSLLVMSIVGGAVVPPIMGAISDRSNIQLAYLAPVLCFVVVLLFARAVAKPLRA